MTVIRAGNDLLDALRALGPRPALAWFGEVQRIELSGAVLANWVIKAIGHFADEIALEPGDLVVLDLPPHWKRLVLALAAWALGARVQLADVAAADAAGTDDAGLDAPRVLATDRPDAPLASDCDELLLLSPVSLALRFDGELPPLAHDWAEEVRANPDALLTPLSAWSGPQPAPDDGASVLLIEGDGLEDPTRMLQALLAGRRLVGPASHVDVRAARDEGLDEGR